MIYASKTTPGVVWCLALCVLSADGNERTASSSLPGRVAASHDVQALYGHADIQTTMIYVHHQPKTAAADALNRIVEAASGVAAVESVSRTAEFACN